MDEQVGKPRFIVVI